MLGFSEIISFYMDFEIRQKTDFDFCIKLKDFMHLFNIYWVLFSKQKCDFSGNFAIFCNFSYYFFWQFFGVKHCPRQRTKQKVTEKISVFLKRNRQFLRFTFCFFCIFHIVKPCFSTNFSVFRRYKKFKNEKFFGFLFFWMG